MSGNLHKPGQTRTRLFMAVLLGVLMAAIAGCTSPAKFQPATGSDNLPPYEGDVRILENLPPSGQYQRVGVVTVEGVLLTKESDMIAAIKAKAAQRGANAVVMQSPVKTSKDSDGSTRRKLAAWAILLNR